MSDVRFRRATPADAAEILDVKREAIEELEHWQYTPEQVAVWAPKESYLDTFEMAIEDDRFVVHLAERPPDASGDDGAGTGNDGEDDEAGTANGDDDGTILGYGALNVEDERIDALYVRPANHGEGVATALIKQLELTAEFQNVGSLDVLAARNAVPFYRSVGYWELDDAVTTVDDVDLDFVRMRKRLSKPHERL